MHDRVTPNLDKPQEDAPAPQVPEARRCILVLGMHRSGTSALTRVVSLLGAALPRNILSANPTNEAGHWEPQRLVDLHDELLNAAGSFWDDCRALDFGRLPEEKRSAFEDRVREIVRDDYADAPTFVLKDPRICRMVPFYIRILEQEGISARPVLVMRNPAAVAKSLARRDGMTEDYAALLWLRHVVDAEQATRGLPRRFVSYEALLSDWREVARRISEGLELGWGTPSAETVGSASSFLRRELQHYPSDTSEIGSRPGVWQLAGEAYAALLDLEQDAVRERAHAALDSVRAQLDGAQSPLSAALFGEFAARRRQARGAKAAAAGLEREVERLRGTAAKQAELSSQLLDTRARMAEAAERALDRAQRAEALEAALREATARTNEFMEVLVERESEIGALQQLAAEHSAEIASLTASEASLRTALARRESENAALQQLAAERSAEIARLSGQLGQHHAEVAALNDEIAKARREADSAKANESLTRRLLGHAYEQLDDMKASTSWRVTKPLRTVKTALLRLRKVPSLTKRRVASLRAAAVRVVRWARMPLPASPAPRTPHPDNSRLSAADISNISIIKRSDLFDSNWYRQTYASYMSENDDPARHYYEIGYKLGLDPSAKFHSRAYLDFYRDVKAAGVNPLVHFVLCGAREGRSPIPSPRQKKLDQLRFTPPETGAPHSVLNFDSYERWAPVGALGRLAVHLHLYYTDLADEACGYLRNIRDPFSLLVSVQESEDGEKWRSFFARSLPAAAHVIVRNVENIGRDVYPWLVTFRDEILDSDVFCHVHTKRSTHNKAHAGWRRFLYHSMMGSPAVVDQIVDLFCKSPDVGVVSPCYFWSLASQPNYGRNKSVCEELYQRLAHKPLPAECPDYPAGSFFWARTRTLKPLLELELARPDFAEEAGQVDGTLAHAVERIIGTLPALSESTLHMVAIDVAYDLRRYINNARTVYSRAIKARSPTAASVSPPRPSRRIDFYTCLSGDYEAPMRLVSRAHGATCTVFTDNPALQGRGDAQVRIANYIHPQPARTARFVKTHPHVWFPESDFACWIDSNIHFLGDIEYYIARLEEAGADCGLILHPARENVIDEAEALTHQKSISIDTLKTQLFRYTGEPTLLATPLIETNFIICRPQAKTVARFFSMWWSEINRYSHRDQMSVGYAMSKSGLRWINLLEPGRSTREHPDFIHFEHDFVHRDIVIDWFRSASEHDLRI